jgi:cytochrome P450
LFRAADEATAIHRQDVPKTLVRLDPPQHTEYRGLLARRFRRTALREIEDHVRELARECVDFMAAQDGTYDFAVDVAMRFPLAVVADMLGLPTEERKIILRMTQMSFGADDPEYRATTDLDEVNATRDFAGYFMGLVADRRENPKDDLTTVLANAVLSNGEPMDPMNLLGYLGILASAGHDTTAASMAGGLLELARNPAQLKALQDDPTLIPNAADEMIRWVAPVNSFMRVAMADTELGGQKIAKGAALLLLYPSANRDDEEFDNPDVFDVRRTPNRHLSFGQGIHYCLGTHLARLELETFFGELLPRLRKVEVAGTPERVRTLFVGGLKHLPVRTEVS